MDKKAFEISPAEVGAGIAAYAAVTALMFRLEAKGVLAPAEIAGLMEHALQGLERLSGASSDRVREHACAYLDSWAQASLERARRQRERDQDQ